MLNPEDIYRMLSEILVNEKDSEFSTSMVDILNSILLTASELFDLRDSLREFNTNVSHLRLSYEMINSFMIYILGKSFFVRMSL